MESAYRRFVSDPLTGAAQIAFVFALIEFFSLLTGNGALAK